MRPPPVGDRLKPRRRSPTLRAARLPAARPFQGGVWLRLSVATAAGLGCSCPDRLVTGVTNFNSRQ